MKTCRRLEESTVCHGEVEINLSVVYRLLKNTTINTIIAET